MKTWMVCMMAALLPLAAAADEQLRTAQFGEPPSAQVTAAEQKQRDKMAWDEANARKQSANIAAMQRSDEDVRAKAQKACGEDFGVPRVGMTLERAKQCLGYAKLVGQVNRADGVASVYTNGRVQLVVMDGKVVAWKGLK